MPPAAPLIGPEHVSLLLEKMNDLVEVAVTADGTHIVTTARAWTDLVEAVDAAGGRASAASLAGVVGLDHVKIGEIIRSFWTDDRGLCIHHDGSFEVLTNAYLVSLACEAEEIAANSGRVTLRDLASGLKLPIEATEALVAGWMRGDDQAPLLLTLSRSRLASGAVVTEAYESTKRDTLKAVCYIATEPRPVEDLMQACHLHPQEEEMALDLLKGLTESGELKGSLTVGAAGARAYMPDSFVKAQHEAAHAFFSANGYLDHATASELQVRKLHAFVKDRHPNAVCLETVVVSRALVEQLEAVADGAVAEASWFEAWTVVPTVLSEAVAVHLVGMCAACQRAEGDPLRVLQLGAFGVSTRFIHEIVACFREEAVSSELDSSPPYGGGACASVGIQPSRGGGGGSSRKGGGKQRRRGGSKKQAESDVDLMSDEETRRFICVCKPELVDFPGLVEGLCSHLAPVLREAKAEAIRRAGEMSSADSFHERADAFETIFERSYSAFQLHCRGVRALRQSLLRQQHPSGGIEGDPCPDPDASSDAETGSGRVGCGSSTASDTRDIEERAETHLLRTLGAQLAELVTARECEKMGIPFASQDGGEARQLDQRMPVISKEACSALAEVLPGDVATSLVHLWHAAMGGSQLSAFCEILQEQVFPACNLVGRRLDKRRERQLIAERQRDMKEILFQSVSEREVFHFAALLVFQSVVAGGVPLLPRPAVHPPLPPPSKAVGTDRQFSWAGVLLNAVRSEVSSEAEQCLSNLQRGIEDSEAAAASTAGDDQGSLDGPEGEGNGVTATNREGSLRVDAAGDPNGETAGTRLWRAAEAARELGLSVAG
eukprot:g14166.t1